MSAELRVRPARPADTDAAYQICLRTGDVGGDATNLHEDHLVMGHVWVGAYLVHQPAHAFVVADRDDRAIGYTVGALDSRAFEARLEREWWPALRRRYPLDAANGTEADRATIALIHAPPLASEPFVADYPSHLHIDLLPAAQGCGMGRRLLDTLLASLADAGSPGVMLGVSDRNERAVGFYRAYGFEELASGGGGFLFGRDLR